MGAESIVGVHLDGSKATEWSREPTCSTLAHPVEGTPPLQASGLGARSLLPLTAADILRAPSKCLLNDFVSVYILDAISPPPTTPNLAPGLLSTYYVLAQAPTPE